MEYDELNVLMANFLNFLVYYIVLSMEYYEENIKDIMEFIIYDFHIHKN